MIKSNSDHVLRVDKAAIKLNLNSLANSSGNLIIACKRNSLCTCLDNENHLNLLFNEDEYDKNCTEHQTKETKKCKLENFTLNEQERDQSNTSNQQNQQSNQNNDDPAMNNQNNQQQNQQQQNQQQQNQQQQNQQQQNQQPNQQNNNDQDNNENNEPNQLNQHHQIPNQLVDINNNIIEPELMIVDINNNLINLPDANFFDLNNNNYLWNNRNIDQPENDDNQNNNSNEQQQQQQQNQENSNQQQNNEHTSQSNNLTILKDKLNCNHILQKSTCTNLQSVQLRQRKKLLELDLNKPRTSNQYYSPMNEEENIIKEECCTSSANNSTNLYLFKRSSSSGRRKKSINCKKCLAKHLTKCDHNSRCEHYHSIDCQTPETELKKNFKKATTPLSLFPITTEIKEQLIDNKDNIENEIKQSNNVSTNIKEQKTNISTNLNASLISQQCPICLFNLNEPCKPNNCDTHSFCMVCLIEWAKVSNECPLCRKCFTAVLNKNGKQMECFINLQSERDLNLEYSALENILNLDDLNWPFIASAFLNTNSTTGQDNLIEQQCEQINNILNSMFGHLEPQNNMDIQWPF